MTTTTTTPTTSADVGSAVPTRLWVTGVVAGAVGAAATSVTAAAAQAAGVAVEISGEVIPASGFATLTVAGALIGVALAYVFSHRAGQPQTSFVRTTVTLTALSIVPDLMIDATIATRTLLATTHLIAAAIIVPALARRLSD